AAAIARHDLAVELERLAGEGGAIAEPVSWSARGPAPFHLGVDRLLDGLDGRVGANQPQAGRRSNGRKIAELGEVEAGALLVGELCERRRCAVRERERQPVRLGHIEAVERNETAGAWLVLYNHGRAKHPGEIGRDQARIDVVAAAGRGAVRDAAKWRSLSVARFPAGRATFRDVPRSGSMHAEEYPAGRHQT